MNRLLSPYEVSEAIGLSYDGVLNLIATRQLEAINLSRGTKPRWKIKLESLESLLASRTQPATTQAPKRVKPVKPVREWV